MSDKLPWEKILTTPYSNGEPSSWAYAISPDEARAGYEGAKTAIGFLEMFITAGIQEKEHTGNALAAQAIQKLKKFIGDK